VSPSVAQAIGGIDAAAPEGQAGWSTHWHEHRPPSQTFATVAQPLMGAHSLPPAPPSPPPLPVLVCEAPPPLLAEAVRLGVVSEELHAAIATMTNPQTGAIALIDQSRIVGDPYARSAR
jgi:hypothetical protein